MTNFGVDVSGYQPPSAIPFGVDFVLARATFGTKPDKRAAEHVKHCRNRCSVGLYHFFVPGQGAAAQGDAFEAVTDSCGITEGDVIPWIDVESPKGDGSCPPRPEWCAELRDLSEALRERFGAVGFYVSQRDFSLLGKPGWMLEHPLWVPHWRTTGGPVATPGGATWTIWQYRVGPYVAGAVHVRGGESALTAIDHDRCDGVLPRIVAAGEPVQPPPSQPERAGEPELHLDDDDWMHMRAERDRMVTSHG